MTLTVACRMSGGCGAARLILVHSGEEVGGRGWRNARAAAVAGAVRRSERSERVAQCRPDPCLHAANNNTLRYYLHNNGKSKSTRRVTRKMIISRIFIFADNLATVFCLLFLWPVRLHPQVADGAARMKVFQWFLSLTHSTAWQILLPLFCMSSLIFFGLPRSVSVIQIMPHF